MDRETKTRVAKALRGAADVLAADDKPSTPAQVNRALDKAFGRGQFRIRRQRYGGGDYYRFEGEHEDAEDIPSIIQHRLWNKPEEYVQHVQEWLDENKWLKGSFSMDDFDMFDDEPAAELSKSRKMFRDLKRGDIFRLKKSNWLVVKRVDDVTAMVYKFPSKGRKMYEARWEGGDEFIVYQIGGSGQRMGGVLDRGDLKTVNKGAGLDKHGELKL